MNKVEIFGLIVSGLVAISLTQKSVLRLRIINLIGSIGFVVYGAMIGSIPVMALNAFTTIVNIYYLRILLHPLDLLEILTPQKGELTFITHFLNFNRDDILHFNPELKPESLLKDDHCRFFPILRNGQPVSLVICRKGENSEWQVLLDYAVPQYRDLKCGRYFYSKAGELLHEDKNQAEKMIALTTNQAHIRYLENLGFIEESEGRFSLMLNN